jgi:hypothetical protein
MMHWPRFSGWKLILDFDGTDDRVPGRQAGTHFHGYYGDYGFLPLAKAALVRTARRALCVV